MKEQMIRGALTAGVMTALSLAGGCTVGPDFPHPVSLSDRTAYVSLPHVPVSRFRTASIVEAVTTLPVPQPLPQPQRISGPRELTSAEKPGAPVNPPPVKPAPVSLPSSSLLPVIPAVVRLAAAAITSNEAEPETFVVGVMVPKLPGETIEKNTHAPDYGWLSGEVDRSQLLRGWQLRYTSVDEEDAHGGSVLLVGNGHLFDDLEEGQQVRVTGHLLNADSHVAGSAYQVESLQVLPK